MSASISNFLDRKLSRRFHTYDLDGDGYIERSDFELAASRLSEEFGLSAGNETRTRLTTLCLSVWDLLASVADRAGDGRITEAQYKAAFAAGLLETPESFDSGYRPFLGTIMDVADTDGDGRLTRAEHERWIRALMNVPEADAREIARRLDDDGDGFIARQDILDAIRAYYFDEAPDSAGSWLLGPLPS
jgi:Ca2+-binding EF-hand superfamily protein